MGKTAKIHTKTHYGFALLRTWMCFVVVLSHFWEPSETLPVILRVLADMRPLAVPVFMTTSFFFVGRSFWDIRPGAIKKRMWRLLWPHVAWTLVYWLIYFPFGFAGLKDLFWQLFTGHSHALNPTMWFQVAMVALYLLFVGVFRLLKKEKAMILCIVLAAAALLVQHSGLHYRIFSPLRYELRYPLGRLVETLPYGVLGICAAWFSENIQFATNRSLQVCAGILLLACGVVLEKTGLLPVTGFGYAGLLLLLKTAGLFCIAWAIPMADLPRAAKKILDIATSYTLGVYCMHRLAHRFIWAVAGTVLENALGIGMLSIPVCVVVYLACYLCSAVAACLRVKPITQMVQ